MPDCLARVRALNDSPIRHHTPGAQVVAYDTMKKQAAMMRSLAMPGLPSGLTATPAAAKTMSLRCQRSRARPSAPDRIPDAADDQRPATAEALHHVDAAEPALSACARGRATHVQTKLTALRMH